MSAGSSAQESSGAESTPDIVRARALCIEALEICDALNLSPEIGARLQEVINAFDESGKNSKAP